MKIFNHIIFLHCAFLLWLCAPAPAFAQNAAAAGGAGEPASVIEDEYDDAGEGGGITIIGERDSPNTVTREDMDRSGAADLWEAVRDIPGVILSGGGRRGDSNFTVRGFGADSVPVYADGIPLANPYRGEGDAARILTGDLESVEISKGYGSELLGANALGGQVLLHTAKPKKPLELSAKTAFGFDSALRYADAYAALKAGTRRKLFYMLGVFQYRNVDHFRLPDSFAPTPGSPQRGGERLWSDSEDIKLTLLAGITPIPALDIWAQYVYQDADKGYSPPDTGKSFSIWHWPLWRRHSASLNGEFITNNVSAKALFYFDKYDNRLDEYYNWKAYELGIHAPHSDYDEYALGGRLSAAWDITGVHHIEGAFTFKLEDHRGLRGNIVNDAIYEVMHIQEFTFSGGAEYVFKMNTLPLTLKCGAGFDTLIPLEYWNEENEFNRLMEAGYYIVKTRTMLLYTWQAGAYYEFIPGHTARITYARKNHFPTMAQRYSTRFGSVLPNSRLGPEIANHIEAGYSGSFLQKLKLHAAAYFSIVEGKMAVIQIPNPEYPSAQVDYTRNLDAVSFYGVELSPSFFPNDYFSAALSFSWNAYYINNNFAGNTVLSYYPVVTLNGHCVMRPWYKALSFIPRFEYTAARYADSLGAEELSAYALFHLKISFDAGKHFTFSAACDNIFDTLYEIRRYSPQAGRSFTVTLEGRY